jgi:Flp pilus assembly protein TadG
MTKPTLRAGERGQILVFSLAAMTAILGVAALSIDAAFMYDKRNRLYAAADAAAKSVALELRRDNTLSTVPELKRYADQQILMQGFNPAGSTNVMVRRCTEFGATCSGSFATNSYFVEIIVTETTSTFFGRFLNWNSATPGGRAVAGTLPGTNCVVSLGLGSTSGIDVGGPWAMSGCNVAVNGNLDGSGLITAREVDVHGTCNNTATCSQSFVHTGTPVARDPLSSIMPPPDPGCSPSYADTHQTCGTAYDVSDHESLKPGTYAGWKVNKVNFNLQPGIYYLTGQIDGKNDVTITGTGVMIYLSPTAQSGGMSIDFKNKIELGTTLTPLSAQTSGPYAGILFYQDRSNTAKAVFDKNNGAAYLSGALYFPSAEVNFAKNNDGITNDCSLIVAARVSMAKSTLSNTCSAFGGSPLMTIALAE